MQQTPSMEDFWGILKDSLLSGYEIPEDNLPVLKLVFYSGALAISEQYVESDVELREHSINKNHQEIVDFIEGIMKEEDEGLQSSLH